MSWEMHEAAKKIADGWYSELETTRKRNAALERENAKLRNLVQMFSKFERNGCHECPMEEDCKVLCVYDGDCGMAVEIDEEMRDLGIEVDA